MLTSIFIAIGASALALLTALWVLAKRSGRETDLGTVSSSWIADYRANASDPSR